MNNIESLYQRSQNLAEFAERYVEYLSSVLRSLDFAVMKELENMLESARNSQSTIFVAGNGGSATTASSMANDLGFDIVKKANTDIPFKVLSLTDNNSVVTAISNDVGYENVFVNQLKVHYRTGDILIVISASGNSPNLIRAVEWVKGRRGKSVALVGFDGGKLKQLCDVSLHFQSEKGEYGPVEDAHLALNHILAHWFQNKLKRTHHTE
jgi:D-sedoheptulose 7-phosphate isomerase